MTMSLKPSLTFITLLALLGLSGCDLIGGGDESADSRLSKEAIATRDAAPEDVFKGVLAGESVFLLLHDCEVYRVETGDKGEVRWQSVLAPDFYPMWTACQRQSMSFEKGALTVTLGRMAFGAGGCCATGGTYRSTDGRNWKKIAD
ncbi:hypothetical protein [Comamonas resistens]|uniref:Uncharacterized protein n=1 Tax=Comamonas resistens TaxID=3046670 RepID=A0ABY8SXA6_9BURK|nr:hypothetical protein [Comamonas resistens]MDL5037860.1 hypothetical protein [Comamonas resistens]WHS67675.1 hypothetical protein QMY55_11410 [Comamonas resistens]